MSEGTFTCVNCQLHFNEETDYKGHYKSEHHRYNVKRKLINLPPLNFEDYHTQFQTDQSSKSQSQSEIYCEVCSKKFMSAGTYKHHINSHKHKSTRRALLYTKDKSESSSMSEFELIDEKKIHDICPFCPHISTNEHLKKAHCFPPFKEECVNLPGLLETVNQKVNKNQCVFCEATFQSRDSAKQHMIDSGHAKLNLEEFTPYEPFYLWKISENSDEEEGNTVEVQDGTGEFTVLQHPTLAEIEEQRQGRIKYGIAGVTINGREVGYRAYRQYYKQYLDRCIKQEPRETMKALEDDQWRGQKCLKIKAEPPKTTAFNNHR